MAHNEGERAETPEGSTEEEPVPFSMMAPSEQRPSAYRPIGERPSSEPPPPDEDVAVAVLDLMLGAALADGEACKRERRATRRIMRRLLSTTILPEWVDRRLESFEATPPDVSAAAERLQQLPIEQRRYVAELVREVCDADHVYALEEERFLLGVVVALALDPEHADDLTVRSGHGLDGPWKRALDLTVAIVVLLFIWPLLLVVALAVKLTSPGPVFFVQRRYGRDGGVIQVFKFRTMRVTEDGAVVRQATQGDPRVTRLGAFLRRSSLDELPQLFNVLRGEMSVVGPRPHAVAHNEQYRAQILEYMLRHKIRPGVTGWAQVNGWRGETDTLEKMIERVSCDLHYIRHYSFWLDVKILFLTAFGRKVRLNAR